MVVWRKSWETAKKGASGIKRSCKLSIGGSVPLLLRFWEWANIEKLLLYRSLGGALWNSGFDFAFSNFPLKADIVSKMIVQ